MEKPMDGFTYYGSDNGGHYTYDPTPEHRLRVLERAAQHEVTALQLRLCRQHMRPAAAAKLQRRLLELEFPNPPQPKLNPEEKWSRAMERRLLLQGALRPNKRKRRQRRAK